MGFASALGEFPTEPIPFEDVLAAKGNSKEVTREFQDQTEATDDRDLLWLDILLCICSAVGTLAGACFLIATLFF